MNTRISPLEMGLEPAENMIKDGRQVALTYLGEKTDNPLFVSDLSHLSKWILQAKDLTAFQPEGLTMPTRPGEVTLENGILIVHLTPTECFLMVLGTSNPEFKNSHYTEMTDAFASFALVGPQCLDVLSKLSPLDLDEPNRAIPCATQGPVEDLRCLLIRLHGRDNIPGLLISIDRGYGHFLLDAFLDAAKEFGMCIAGWNRFEDWLNPNA
jgi:hypothetical protein